MAIWRRRSRRAGGRICVSLTLAGLVAACGATVGSPAASPAPSTPAASAATSPSAAPASSSPAATAAEQQLLDGVRLDVMGSCAPIREGLAAKVAGAIRCAPASEVVKDVTLYLYDTRADLLDAYGAYVTSVGIPPRSHGGRCLEGQASEGAYVPGDDRGLVPERGACHLDGLGSAHYIATLPPFVLAIVDGRVGDMAAVERWAWLGNQDQPGNPTIWVEGVHASPEK